MTSHALAGFWVDGRAAYEEDRGHSPAEARRRAWDAWNALSVLEKRLYTTFRPERPAAIVAGPTGAN